ncbi:MAG: TraB/GumN family protein [Paracoccus sp. (in: a-proteobacteria)]
MRQVLTPLLACLVAGFCAGAALAQDCSGRDLIAALPQADRAEIERRVAEIPYHQGIFWRASKGDARITLIGTYHFDDPVHDATVARFAPEIRAADRLLVELGPGEEAELMAAMARDPALMMDPTGPTLPERLSEEDWQALSEALSARGIPAIMASRLRPWYVATLLSLAPCMIRQLASGEGERGLDWQLMDVAAKADVPIAALEPWDTVLEMFTSLSPEDEIDMIVYSLPVAGYADDYGATLSAAYAAGDVWQIWEFGRLDAYRNSGLPEGKVDEMTDEAQELLMDRRNRSWIAPLTDAAAAAATDGEGVVAAFGALHLSGEDGVLRLLEKEGWTTEPVR